MCPFLCLLYSICVLHLLRIKRYKANAITGVTCNLVSNVNVKDARYVVLGRQSVFKQCSKHCRLVNGPAVKWNADDQRTVIMSVRLSCRLLQLLSQPLHFERLTNTGAVRFYHSHTAATHTIQQGSLTHLDIWTALQNMSVSLQATLFFRDDKIKQSFY